MRSSLLCLLLLLPPPALADDVSALLADLTSLREQGLGSTQARTAWDQLVQHDAKVLPAILKAMNTDDVVVANWLRSAFDRIVAREMPKKSIDVDALSAFVRDTKNHGRPRRLALELVERIRPGTRARLLPSMLDDAEFRYDAIEAALAKLDAAELPTEKQVTTLRQLFEASRDFKQARQLYSRLQKLGVEVSVADHFGFLRDWYVLGPFDAKNMTSFTRVYPPEKQVELDATLPGKAGKSLTWKRFQVPETPTGRRPALVNLRTPLGDANDAVAYAFAKIEVDEPREVEFRGAGDDHFTVWVHGQRVFGFEEYRNGVRIDRHRFRVRLRKGTNTILVKVAQAPLDEVNPAPNWEFLLRISDSDGKGLLYPSAFEKED